MQNNIKGLNLKRTEFARRLRKQDIQIYKQKIRKQVFDFEPSHRHESNELQMQKYSKATQSFCFQKFKQYFQQAKSRNFQDQTSIAMTTQYLMTCQLQEITRDELAFRYLRQLLKSTCFQSKVNLEVQTFNEMPPFIQEIINKVRRLIKGMIFQHVNSEFISDRLDMKQTPLIRTFHQIFQIIFDLPIAFFGMFTEMAKARQPEFTRRAALNFISVCQKLPFLSQQLADAIVDTIYNFQEVNLQYSTLSFQTDKGFIEILESLLKQFNFRQSMMIKIVQTVDNILVCGSIKGKNNSQEIRVIKSSLNQRVYVINQQFSILPALFNHLQTYAAYVNPFVVKQQIQSQTNGNNKVLLDLSQKTKQKTPEINSLIISLLKLLGRVFSTDNQVSQKVYQKSLNILDILRDYLPFARKGTTKHKKTLMLQHQIIEDQSSVKVISHNDQQILKQVLFCISNIIATDISLAQILIKQDLYDCLVKLYQMARQSVRLEIAHVIYVLIYQFSQEIVRLIVLIENRIVYFLSDMLELSLKSPQISIKVLQSLQIIMSKGPQIKTQDTICGYYEILIGQIRAQRVDQTIEGLLMSQNTQIAALAQSILNYL